MNNYKFILTWIDKFHESYNYEVFADLPLDPQMFIWFRFFDCDINSEVRVIDCIVAYEW